MEDDIFACLLDLNVKESKLTNLNFKESKLTRPMF